MRLVPSDCVWIDAETAGPLAAVWISLAEGPDACDAPPILSLVEMKSLWDEVVKQVKRERLALGVYARLPATGIELDDSKKR